MKSFIFAAAAAFISSVSAQGVSVGVNVNVGVAVGANNCTSTSYLPGTQTITDLTVSTYCPVCDAAKATGGSYTTVYATVLLAVCPTGYSSATYTVTAVATGTTAIDVAALPAGFTTTATVCNACPGQPTVTVTVPIDGAAATEPAGSAATITQAAVPGSAATTVIPGVAAGTTAGPRVSVTFVPSSAPKAAGSSFAAMVVAAGAVLVAMIAL